MKISFDIPPRPPDLSPIGKRVLLAVLAEIPRAHEKAAFHAPLGVLRTLIAKGYLVLEADGLGRGPSLACVTRNIEHEVLHA